MKKRLIIVLSMCLSYYIHGQNWEQKGEDIPGEAAADFLGRSVSLSDNGNIMAIGAPWNDETGENSGHVRVYNYNVDTANWEQIGNDINGEAAGDRFGESISLSSDGYTLAVGAWLNDEIGINGGHVRVFEYNVESNTWEQKGADLDAETQLDYFGISVSLSNDGNTVAIGAEQSSFSAGDVYVYEYNKESEIWQQKGASIVGQSRGDRSGKSVSLSADGSIVAIGSILNDESDTDSGQVRVFEYNLENDAWQQMGANINGKSIGDRFGGSVSLAADGLIVAIGSTLNSENGSASGHVRVFKYNLETQFWEQMGVDINGKSAGDRFGGSVSLSNDGSVLAVGARLNDETGTDSGQVRVFEYNSRNEIWQQIGTDLNAGDAYDNYGISVSLSGNGSFLAVGSDQSTNIFNNSKPGYVRVLEFIDVTLSLNEENLNIEAFELFPNPAVKALNVVIPSVFIEKISVYKANGAFVLSKICNGSNAIIPVQNVASGNYIIKINTDKGEVYKHFIKN